MDTVGRNKKQMQEYIKKQLEEDQITDQMSLFHLEQYYDAYHFGHVVRESITLNYSIMW